MRMLVTPMRYRGVSMSPQDRGGYQGVTVDVRVTCIQDDRLGRAIESGRNSSLPNLCKEAAALAVRRETIWHGHIPICADRILDY